MNAQTHSSLFNWCDSYRIGDDYVDGQHRQLFTILARLQQAMDVTDGHALIESTLNELIDYTQRHFRDEEALMAKLGYPELEAHKALHDELITKVEDLLEEFLDGEPILTIELLIFLKEWLAHHILEEDMKVGRFLA